MDLFLELIQFQSQFRPPLNHEGCSALSEIVMYHDDDHSQFLDLKTHLEAYQDILKVEIEVQACKQQLESLFSEKEDLNQTQLDLKNVLNHTIDRLHETYGPLEEQLNEISDQDCVMKLRDDKARLSFVRTMHETLLEQITLFKRSEQSKQQSFLQPRVHQLKNDLSMLGLKLPDGAIQPDYSTFFEQCSREINDATQQKSILSHAQCYFSLLQSRSLLDQKIQDVTGAISEIFVPMGDDRTHLGVQLQILNGFKRCDDKERYVAQLKQKYENELPKFNFFELQKSYACMHAEYAYQFAKETLSILNLTVAKEHLVSERNSLQLRIDQEFDNAIFLAAYPNLTDYDSESNMTFVNNTLSDLSLIIENKNRAIQLLTEYQELLETIFLLSSSKKAINMNQQHQDINLTKIQNAMMILDSCKQYVALAARQKQLEGDLQALRSRKKDVNKSIKEMQLRVDEGTVINEKKTKSIDIISQSLNMLLVAIQPQAEKFIPSEIPSPIKEQYLIDIDDFYNRIQSIRVYQTRMQKQWCQSLYDYIQSTPLDKENQLKACQLFRDLHFEYQNPQNKIYPTLTQYMTTYAIPGDVQSLLDIKPAIALGHELKALGNKPLNDLFHALHAKQQQLQNKYPMEACLLGQLISNLHGQANTVQSTKANCLNDQRYQPLFKHRGILIIVDKIQDLLQRLADKFSLKTGVSLPSCHLFHCKTDTEKLLTKVALAV